jgi:GNAT superfamily N-acetyltransferase
VSNGSPIRPARPDDYEQIRRIESSAGELFAEIGMVEVAADEPWSDEELASYVSEARAWVATDDRDRALGYALVDVVEGCAHLEQLSVHRRHQRQGVGRALARAVATWARARGMPAITLTTFTSVPWNAPYYDGLGFRRLDEAELTPGLIEIRAHEADEGLDPALRVCMRLALEVADL